MADKKWMLDTLLNLTQGAHPYFAKDYVAIKRKKINALLEIQ